MKLTKSQKEVLKKVAPCNSYLSKRWRALNNLEKKGLIERSLLSLTGWRLTKKGEETLTKIN